MSFGILFLILFSKQLYYITLFLALQQNERGAGKFFPKYSDNQKWATPLISPLCGQLPPGGKPVSKAAIKISDDFVTVRYETGDARPPGGRLSTGGSLEIGIFRKKFLILSA